MTVPSSYNVDFSSAREDLQTRAVSRLLSQFHRSPVLLQLLWAYMSEVQALSTAIWDLMEFRTLAKAQGKTLDAIGKIVGQVGAGYSSVALGPILMEDGVTPMATEADATVPILAMHRVYNYFNDVDHATAILLKIACNFTKYCSVPEITAAIHQATGVTTKLQRRGPAAMDVRISPDIDPVIIAMLDQVTDIFEADGVYLFPYPATCMVSVAYTSPILCENGQVMLAENGVEILITELTRV